MRQSSVNVPPPGKRSLVGNVANNWRTFKRNFYHYSIASKLSKEADTKYQASVFLAAIDQDVFDIYDGLEFVYEEDKMDLEIVMKKIGFCGRNARGVRVI